MTPLHAVGISVGCVLALVPALLPSAEPTRRWPHVVMALGMAAGHLGGLFGGPPLGGTPAGHTHAGGSLVTMGLVIGLVWTCARLIRVLPERGGKRRSIGQNLCSAGMAASMTFMAALPL